MSHGSRDPSHAPSTSSGSSIGPPEWTCVNCQAEGAEVELVEHEGNMVCPQCALIDATASSARGHVDINDISGQIVDKTQTLQTLQTTWNDRSTWHDRGFMAHVDTVLAALTNLVACNSSFNLLNGARLWFNDLRKAEYLDGGWKHMSKQTKTPKLVLQLNMAVRMATQEMNLISVYNKLKGKKHESPTAVRGYTKGDDRVPVLELHEYFDLNQQLPSSSPGRMSNFKYWRQGNLRYERLIEYKLSPCDYMMSLIHRVMLPLQALVQASSEERKPLLQTKPPKPTPSWPDGVLDDLKRIRDWDAVFQTAHDLWQAQNCVSLFASDNPAAQSSAAVVLTLMACESVMGISIKSSGYALEHELASRLGLGLTGCRFRRSELDRLVLSWSTSISELGLPVPSVRRSKASSMIGVGDRGWGSDKRRGIPRKAILPVATKAIAAHWQEIKKVRLARQGILPLDEECALARRMFAGHRIDVDLAVALARNADPLLPPNDADWGSEDDTASEVSLTPSEVGYHHYSGDMASFVNPRYNPDSNGPLNRRFWRNPYANRSSTTPSATTPQTLAIGGSHSIINKPDMIQAWIENGDASSSDEPDSSDEEMQNDDSRPAKRAKDGLDVSHIGELPQPFAFSIGHGGFSVEKAQTPSLPTPAPTLAPVSSAGPSRAQSVETVTSDAGLTAASESCQMVRQLSAAPSATSTTASLTARRPAPLRATLTPAPVDSTNGSLPSARAEREAIRRGRRHPDDHTGVLIREKKEYFNIGRINESLRHATEQPADSDVIKSINLWVERKRPLARNPPLPDGKYSNDLRKLIHAHAHRQSPLETLLRAGVGPNRIPQHMIHRSVCATNMDLFHYADRDAILGLGDVKETDELLDMSLRLFFRGFGNDTLPEVFLNDEEIKTRITSYHYKGHWDVLADSTPVPKPKFRKRKREVQAVPDNMSQRIASEYERGINSEQEEEEMIQQAVLAGLLVVKPLHPWDPYKSSASVPSLWYIDDLFELGLVDKSKLGPQEAWETAESTWARRKKQEERGEVDMPMPEGAGAAWMAKMGCVMVDGVVTRLPRQRERAENIVAQTQTQPSIA